MVVRHGALLTLSMEQMASGQPLVELSENGRSYQ